MCALIQFYMRILMMNLQKKYLTKIHFRVFCLTCRLRIINPKNTRVCVCTLNEHTKRSNFDADKLTLTGNEWARARITIPQTDYTAGLYLNIINNKQVQTILV